MIRSAAVWTVAIFACLAAAEDYCSAFRNLPDSVIINDNAEIDSQAVDVEGRKYYFFNPVPGVPFAVFMNNDELTLLVSSTSRVAFPTGPEDSDFDSQGLIQVLDPKPVCYVIAVLGQRLYSTVPPSKTTFDLKLTSEVSTTSKCGIYSILGEYSDEVRFNNQSIDYLEVNTFMFLVPAAHELDVYIKTVARSIILSVKTPGSGDPTEWNRIGRLFTTDDPPMIRIPANYTDDRCLAIVVEPLGNYGRAHYDIIAKALNSSEVEMNPCAPFKILPDGSNNFEGDIVLLNQSIQPQETKIVYYAAYQGSSFTVFLNPPMSLYVVDANQNPFPEYVGSTYSDEDFVQVLNVTKATCFAVGVKHTPYDAYTPVITNATSYSLGISTDKNSKSSPCALYASLGEYSGNIRFASQTLTKSRTKFFVYHLPIGFGLSMIGQATTGSIRMTLREPTSRHFDYWTKLKDSNSLIKVPSDDVDRCFGVEIEGYSTGLNTYNLALTMAEEPVTEAPTPAPTPAPTYAPSTCEGDCPCQQFTQITQGRDLVGSVFDQVLFQTVFNDDVDYYFYNARAGSDFAVTNTNHELGLIASRLTSEDMALPTNETNAELSAEVILQVRNVTESQCYVIGVIARRWNGSPFKDRKPDSQLYSLDFVSVDGNEENRVCDLYRAFDTAYTPNRLTKTSDSVPYGSTYHIAYGLDASYFLKVVMAFFDNDEDAFNSLKIRVKVPGPEPIDQWPIIMQIIDQNRRYKEVQVAEANETRCLIIEIFNSGSTYLRADFKELRVTVSDSTPDPSTSPTEAPVRAPTIAPEVTPPTAIVDDPSGDPTSSAPAAGSGTPRGSKKKLLTIAAIGAAVLMFAAIALVAFAFTRRRAARAKNNPTTTPFNQDREIGELEFEAPGPAAGTETDSQVS